MNEKFINALERAREILNDRCDFDISYNPNYIYLDNFIRSIFINNAIDEASRIEYPSSYGRSAYAEVIIDNKKYSYDNGLGSEDVEQGFDSFMYVSGTKNTTININKYMFQEDGKRGYLFQIKIKQLVPDHSWSSTSALEETDITEEHEYFF